MTCHDFKDLWQERIQGGVRFFPAVGEGPVALASGLLPPGGRHVPDRAGGFGAGAVGRDADIVQKVIIQPVQIAARAAEGGKTRQKAERCKGAAQDR